MTSWIVVRRSRSAGPTAGVPVGVRRGDLAQQPAVLRDRLGSLLESNLRRSLLICEGDPTGFLSRPISGTLLVVFVLVAVLPAFQALRHRSRGAPGHAAVPAQDTDKKELV